MSRLQDELHWHKSSYSNNNGGACVEIAAAADGGRYLRDTKDRTLPAHYFTPAAWQAFITGIKTSELE